MSVRQDDGAFARSAGGAVFRGALLIALAVVIGVVLLSSALDDGADTVNAGNNTDVNDPAGPDGTTPVTTGGNGDDGTTSTTQGPPRPPNEVAVLVANGAGGVQGAAGAMTEQIQAAGYQVREETNAKQQVQATVVYYVEGFQREAATLAEKIGANPSTVQAIPNPPPVDDLRQANVVVVLGPDLAKPAA